MGRVLCFGLLLGAALGPRLAQAEAAPITLDFGAALEAGWRANLSIEQARASLARAEALVVQARASWLPTLTLNGSFTQLDQDRSVSGRITTAASTLNANLLLQVPLLTVSRWQATGQAADARDVARIDVDAVRRAVAALVGRAWLDVRLREQAVEIAERALKVSAEAVELAQAKSAGGIGTRLETARNERERADNASRLALSRADLAVAKNTLGALLNVHAEVGVRGEPELPPVPAELSWAARPDLRAAEARVALAERSVEESWTEYLPTLSAALGPFLQTPAYAPTPELGFQLQVLLSAPLFDGLSRSGRSAEREALLAAARSDRDALFLAAETQLRSALSSLQERRAATEAARRSAELAEEAFQLAKLALAEGISTNLELIEAERAARDASTNASLVMNSAEVAQLDVLIALGLIQPQEKP